METGVTRNERQRKTKARILQYDAANTPTMSDEIRSPEALLEGLRKPVPDTTKLKLVVVEDLSRDVIETLGDYLKIEPEFFRAHILDYVWSNVRDFWRSPPNLSVMIRHQTWFQLRFVRARYFKSGMGFKEGFDEALTFNVARRPDDDQSNTSIWDDVEGKVGLTRSKVSFWMKPSNGNEPAVGVLLLDPTITKGFHLWHGYRNWAEPPNMYDKDDIGNPQQSTLFQDYLYWACRPETFLMNDHGNNNADNSSVFKLPIAVLLHLVCAEWQTISDYVKTRLNQVDWEIAQPDKFIPSPSPDTPAHQTPIDRTLLKLHAWRRYVPMFREMLSETLIHIFKATPSTSITAVHGRHNDETLSLAPPRESSYLSLIKDDPTVTAYRTDFELVLSYMEECQQRIDRLTHVATAAISIQDSRRSIRDNNNIQYLTYLATFFIPMSLVAALLSMQPDVSELGDTMKVWAEASLPIAFVILLVTVIVSYVRALKSYQ
ncbi:hypothetical protein F4810DRAFT_692957 [Camillea tinctor]|nr:hypothetical protein F4810DRAFT_692957 [Camillea tinctor]